MLNYSGSISKGKSQSKREEMVMIKPKIGEDAGTLYRYLEGNGAATMAKMKKDLHLGVEDLHLALGWLAREDKINVSKQGTSHSVSLVAR